MPVLPVFNALLVVVFLYASFASMATQWSSSTTFTYGFFVAPVALGLIWSRRGRLHRTPRSPAWLPLALMVPTAIVWCAGMVLHIALLHHAAAVALLVLAIWAAIGHAATRVIAFPLLYLFFMVPFGETLVPWLMTLTADATVLGVQVVGIPVFKDGFLFSLPSGDFEVIKACSGIRFLMTTLAAGAVFAWLAYRSATKRLVFMLACVAVPIIANVVRTFGVVMVAHASDLRFGAGTDHVIAGTLFFTAVLFGLFVVGARFADAPGDDAVALAGGGTFARPAAPRFAVAGVGIGLALVLLSISLLPPLLEQRRESLSMVELPVLPGDFGNWERQEEQGTSWRPSFVGADAEVLARYRSATGSPAIVDVYAAAYGIQSEERELTGSLNRMYAAPWRVLETSRRSLREETFQLEFAEAVLGQPGGGGRVVWHWYEINDTMTPGRLAVKLLELGALLRGDALASGVMALSAPYADEPEEGRVALGDWLNSLCGRVAGADWRPPDCRR